MSTTREFFETLKQNPYFPQLGWRFHNVSWEDAGRAKNSCLGGNISDWTLCLRGKGGQVAPVLRKDNFSDQTLTLRASDICLVVEEGGIKKPVTFQNYLENFGRYTEGVPNHVNLSLTKEDLVTIRFMAVIVPEDENGSCQVVPTVYNYQTCDEKNPRNFVGASFHMGTGVRTDGEGGERIYLVKREETGELTNTWFKITNESMETETEKSVSESVLGTRSSELGRNRVLCFQIPRQKDEEDEDEEEYGPIISRGGSGGSGGIVPVSNKGVSVGNVSHGDSEGRYSVRKLDSYEREKGSVPTLSFVYYYTSRDGKVSEETAKEIVSNMEKDYLDLKGIWKGSLVEGKGEYINGNTPPPPIQLSELSKKDLESISKKNLGVFPGE